MILKEYGMQLKHELLLDSSQENIAKIAKRIDNASIDGNPLTKEQKDELLRYITNDYTKDGKVILKESDNSQWIKAMSILKAMLDDSSN